MCDWNRGGKSLEEGYYWIKRRVGSHDEQPPKIETLWADYRFADDTEWFGPLLPPNAKISPPRDAG